jgi:hypothetical protein
METKIYSPNKLNLKWQSVPLLVLLVILFQSMIVGVTEVIQGLEVELIWPLIAEAIILIWLLSHFRVKGWVAAILAAVLGFVLVLSTIGSLWDEWGELMRWITYYFASLFRAIIHDSAYPTSGPIFYALGQLLQDIWVLLERLWTWVSSIPQPKQDLFAIGLVWSLVMWFTAIWATWFSQHRSQPFIGAIPVIILVGALRAYSHASSSIMLTTLGATLALLVIVSQMKREQNWNEENVGFSHVIQRNSTWAAVLLSVTLVFSAEIISSININDLFDRFSEPELSTVGEIENENPIGVDQSDEVMGIINEFRESISGGLPNNNLIGSGPELSDQVVMYVRLEEVDPVTSDYLPVSTDSTYYFRSLTYEYYSTKGWTSNVAKVFGYNASQALINKYTTNQHLFHQEVEYIENMGGIIHTVGELASVDTDYYVSWRERDKDGNLVDMFGAWIDDDNYRAFSIAPIYTENQLRQSQPVYPNWILERYLQLSGSVSERVLDITQELTSSQPTHYDKAVAIERYLRSFPYTLDLPDKPVGVDIADYFLFDVRKGYCDYYASTMVVMARAAGLPARFVSGFIGGTYDQEAGHFVVTADLAHSWVEIYFPEHGWISFEPTAGRPSIDRLYDRVERPIEEIAIEDQEVEPAEEPETSNLYSPIVKSVLQYSFIITISGITTWLFVDTRIMRRQTPMKVFAKLYRRLERVSRHLGLETPDTFTPYEFSTSLQRHMIDITRNRITNKLLQSVPKEIKWLIEQAILAAYSPDPPDKISRYRAIRTWAKLRWQLFFAILVVRYSYIEKWFRNNLLTLLRKKPILQQGFEEK